MSGAETDTGLVSGKKMLEQLTSNVQQWSQKATESLWLSNSDAGRLAQAEARTPSSLFDSAERPLVVAFFGGTGVGKSTLLNRIAGAEIARSSAERPTSREITLYLHSSNKISRLPDDFPVEKINQASHDNDKHRSVLWIDMPDFDSAESANRELVDEWLPHIDMLVYVVSPERYRDDQGWRLLLQHGQRHAWVFVINHWDRGSENQRHAFHQIISEAGLENPMIFCTDCGPYPDKPNGDEFEAFDNTVQNMASDLIIKQLEERGVLIRIQQASEQVNTATTKFGNDTALASLETEWQSGWQSASKEMVNSLEWKFKQLSLPFAEHDKGFFSSLLSAVRRQKPQLNDIPTITVDDIVDDTTLNRIGVSLDGLHQNADTHGLPAAPLRQCSTEISERAKQHFQSHIKSSMDESIALPGTPLQRKTCQVLGILSTLLPVLAAGWAIYKLVSVYATDKSSGQAYLGFDFATHSLLMIAFGWFVPWFLKQRLRPRLASAARRGMRNGTLNALDSISSEVSEKMTGLEQQRQDLLAEAGQLFTSTPGFPAELFGDSSSTLSRVLVQQPTAAGESARKSEEIEKV